MLIELIPDPGPADDAARAAAEALAMERLASDRAPSAHGGAWGRAGLIEAIERHPEPPGHGRVSDRYVSRARSTRGATRA
jgi:hypothetical protein